MIGVGDGDQDSGLRLAELVAAFSLARVAAAATVLR
jgi:hypothetical protein